MAEQPVIITAAITGAMTVPAQSPHIPVTVDEIATSAIAAAEAGAAIVHVHVREEDGRPSARPELFAELLAKLDGSTDAIVQVTTGGGVGMTIEERARALSRFRPEMATLNAGSFNFALHPVAERITEWRHDWEAEYLESSRDYVFRNTFKDLEYMCAAMRENGVKPQLEVYDVGHLYNIRHLLDRGLLDPPLDIQLVMGVLGAIAPRPQELLHLTERARDLLGEHSWSVAGIGYRGQFRMAAMALAMGGNVRVGLEDNLRLSPTQMAPSNAALVAKAVRLAGELDRPAADPDQARRLLGIVTADTPAHKRAR